MKWDNQTIIALCAITMVFLALGKMIQTGHGAIIDRLTDFDQSRGVLSSGSTKVKLTGLCVSVIPNMEMRRFYGRISRH